MSPFHSVISLSLSVSGSAQRTCESNPEEQSSRTGATRYKLAAIFSILAASLIGVSLPILGKKIPALRLDNDVFFVVKAFAAGVILATGFVHMLPDAFESLTSPCLGENPWGSLPFSGFVALISAVGTMMMDAFATGFYQRLQRRKAQPVKEDEEMQCENQGHVHGPAFVSGDLGPPELLRHRIIAQVGMIVHSVIIGIFLGASESTKTIKPLVATLVHAFPRQSQVQGNCSNGGFLLPDHSGWDSRRNRISNIYKRKQGEGSGGGSRKD